MPVFHITAPDGTQYEVNGPDGATEQDALAQVQAQHQAAAPPAAPATPRSFGQRANDFMQGVGEGAFSIPQHAAAIGARMLDATGLTDHAFQNVQGATQEANNRELNAQNVDQNSGAFKTGHVTGQVAGSVPVAAAFPQGLVGALGANAATGALTADPAHAGAGAVLGTLIGAPLQGLGSVVNPTIEPAVQRLAQSGVRMTPGQVFQGTAKKLEDRAAGFPFVENSIGAAKNDSLRTFGTAAGNEALSPMGPGIIPAGVSGQAMSQTAHDAFDNSYHSILPNLSSVTLDPNVGATIANNSATLAARMPDGVAGQFDSTLQDVFKKLYSTQPAAPTNAFPGQSVKDVMVDLGAMSRQHTIPSSGVNDRALGSAYGDVRGALRDSINSSDPVLGPQLQATDAAYKGFIPVDKAVRSATGNANGLEAGVFTPRQLRSAVLSGDSSARGNMGSQGLLPLQQLAEDGIQILPSSVADSGTAGRLTLADMLAHAIRNPVGAVAMAAPAVVAGATYSRPVLSAVNSVAARGGVPGGPALASIFQNMARYGAGPAAGAATGGGK